MGGSLSRQDRLGQVPSEIASRILLLRDDALVRNRCLAPTLRLGLLMLRSARVM